MTTAAEGSTKIVYADAQFFALVDRATKGAASDFIETCRPTLEAIRGDAMSRWPVKTGKSRDAFQIKATITPTEVRASLVNTSGYAYYIKYSKWTSADLHAYVREQSAGGTSPPALANVIRREMLRKHGKGAPSEAVAGKHAWTLLVQRPQKASLAELMPRLQASMDRLAGAT